MSNLISRADVTEILADLYWDDDRPTSFKKEVDKVYEKNLSTSDFQVLDSV